MRARLLRGIGANLYAQAITALVQLASVPLLVAAWGPARFGRWSLLTAVPAALGFADGGLVLAGGASMAMLAAQGRHPAAAALFRRMVRRVAMAVLGLGLLAGCGIAAMPDSALATVLPMPPVEARPVLTQLVAVTLLGVLGTLPGAAFRAGGLYGFGTMLGATLRLAETAATVATAASGAGFATAALAWLGTRALGTAILLAAAHRRLPWLGRPAPRSPALSDLRAPARAALLLPACFAIALQGVTLAIGAALSPQAVGAFVAARTLARTLVQATGLVTHALMPEMAAASGRGDAAAVVAIARLNDVTALAMLVPGGLAMIGLGPGLFAAWTGGHLWLPPGTWPLIVAAALLHGLWLSRANLLLAVNRQAAYAGPFFLVAVATAGLAALAARFGGLPAVAGVTALAEAVMLLRLTGLDRRHRPVVFPLTEGLAR